MLNASRESGAAVFDLHCLCDTRGIPATIHDLANFAKDNHPHYGDKSMSSLDRIRFQISSEGLRHAKAIEEGRRPPSMFDRLSDEKLQRVGNLGISFLSLLIAAGALIVSVIAIGRAG